MNHIASPDTSDAGIERLIQTKGKTAPRVTPTDIEANIESEYYFTAADGVDGSDIAAIRAQDQSAHVTLQPMADDPQIWRTGDVSPLHLLTFCVLVLKNGFTVTGESACASPENFDAEIGRKIARQNAVQKIWPLMGYELRSKLASEKPEADPDYTWSNVVKAIHQNTVEGFVQFKVTMNDGKVYQGELVDGFFDDMNTAILSFCNKVRKQ